jgi:hypothetical protein
VHTTPEDKRVYLDHMGDEDRISKENYQIPFGLKEVAVMGKMLNRIDGGMYKLLQN